MRHLACALAVQALLGCSPGAPVPAKDVIGWAVGSGQFTPDSSAADRYLVILPTKQPAQAAKPASPCLKATAFLPAPAPDLRIFFLVGREVYVRRAPGTAPEKLAIKDPAKTPAIEVTRLLAFDKHASPLEMLVVARAKGSDEEQIWVLTLDESAIRSAKPAPKVRAFTSQQAFFAQYRTPRCLDGEQRCLRASEDSQGGSYLDVEPVRGPLPEKLQELGPIQVVDAAWATADGSSVYLLVPCH